MAVGLDKMPCPQCRGKNENRPPYKGWITGLRIWGPRACMCKLWKRYYSRWCNPANVAADYRSVTIDNLEDYAENLNGFPGTSLEEMLTQVRTHEFNCYLLAGPSGTGKTTLITGMYHRALRSWAEFTFQNNIHVPAVWKVTASALAKQFRDWEMREVGRDADSGKPTPPPEVTVEKVHAAIRAGLTPCLFLEELDKIKLDSDFQAKEFSAIIDVIQSNGGQVVAASNLSNIGLKNALGEQYGPAIIGARLNAETPDNPTDPAKGGFLIDFRSGMVQQNVPLPDEASWKGARREATTFQQQIQRHNRQAIIPEPREYTEWLTDSERPPLHLLRIFPDDDLVIDAVDPSPKTQTPELPQRGLFDGL